MDLMKANTENLINLWTSVGKSSYAFYQTINIGYCIVNYSEWPNRLWFSQQASYSDLENAKMILKNFKAQAKISYWHSPENNVGIFEQMGFKKSSEQIGMSLHFQKNYNPESTVELRPVIMPNEARLWSDLFQKSFNYAINHNTVIISCNEVNYYVAYVQNIPIGTCILYHHNPKVIGIHSMGIIPEQRRQGYGENVFKEILFVSQEKGFSYATLQASAMGKSLYEKFGFTAQFKMYNYQLKN